MQLELGAVPNSRMSEIKTFLSMILCIDMALAFQNLGRSLRVVFAWECLHRKSQKEHPKHVMSINALSTEKRCKNSWHSIPPECILGIFLKETPGAILDILAEVAIDCPQKSLQQMGMETSTAQVIRGPV